MHGRPRETELKKARLTAPPAAFKLFSACHIAAMSPAFCCDYFGIYFVGGHFFVSTSSENINTQPAFPVPEPKSPDSRAS